MMIVRMVRGLLCVMLLSLCLSGPLPAGDEVWRPHSVGAMVDTMWELMERFSGRCDPWRAYSGPFSPGLSPNSSYWPRDDVSAIGALEGVWLAQSGEYWALRHGQFALVQPWGAVAYGEYLREGPFLRVFGPWGERRLEYRQMGEWLFVQDVHGEMGMLRRIQHAHWSW